jgi:hypothetical protein
MADDGNSSSSVGIVAIIAIFLIILVGAFVLFRGNFFGGGTHKVDINVSTPSTK